MPSFTECARVAYGRFGPLAMIILVTACITEILILARIIALLTGVI